MPFARRTAALALAAALGGLARARPPPRTARPRVPGPARPPSCLLP
ncbi:proteinase inhibitor I4 serpin, partial [Micromonospora provocatoris]